MSGSQQSFDVFDVRKIRKLISLMQENDLTEIDLKHADSAVRIKRGGEVASYSAPAIAQPVAPAAPAEPAAPARIPRLEVTPIAARPVKKLRLFIQSIICISFYEKSLYNILIVYVEGEVVARLDSQEQKC